MRTELLTGNELEIMNLLWGSGRPLSRAEIIEKTPNRSWSESSIHVLLNKMLDKEVIGVDGFIKTRSNFGRTYVPKLTQDTYIKTTIELLKPEKGDISPRGTIKTIYSALVYDECVDDELIKELEEMLAERKKKIK